MAVRRFFYNAVVTFVVTLDAKVAQSQVFWHHKIFCNIIILVVAQAAGCALFLTILYSATILQENRKATLPWYQEGGRLCSDWC